jgi:hypothetical protein
MHGETIKTVRLFTLGSFHNYEYLHREFLNSSNKKFNLCFPTDNLKIHFNFLKLSALRNARTTSETYTRTLSIVCNNQVILF